jgi:ABC-type phosphate transport system ATPase subunit
MYLGRLIGRGKNVQIFGHPTEELAEIYMTGRFGQEGTYGRKNFTRN